MKKIAAVSLLLAIVGTAPAQAPPAVTPPPPREPIGTFSFLHVSDPHLGPHLEMPASLDDQRSYKAIRTIVGLGSVLLEPLRITAPPPEFVALTGDVVEYGFPDPTLAVYDKYFEGISIPQFWTTGNHDNTWVSDNNELRRRHGGVNYAFEYEGVHFIFLNSASIQDPLPSFSHETIEYLKGTLAGIPVAAPIFVLFHHPLENDGFASNYDKDRLVDALRGHNVVSLFVGHHHAAVYKKTYGELDEVHGGSTFSKEAAANPVDGYSVCLVDKGMLSVVYRYLGQENATKELLHKPLAPGAPYPRIEFSSPRESRRYTGDSLSISVSTSLGDATTPKVFADIDDEKTVELTLRSGKATGKIDTTTLDNGAHFLRVRFETADGGKYQRSVSFFVERKNAPGQGRAIWRTQLDGGSRATPLLYNGNLYVGANDGSFYSLRAKDGKERWKKEIGAEVIGSATTYGGQILFGATDGTFRSLLENGNEAWIWKDAKGVYSSPTVDEKGIVYFGTNGADLIALNAETGKEVWRNTDPDYAIEAAPTIAGDLLLFGAWDGYLHAVDRRTGKSAWKTASPRSQERLVRYYGSADTAPVVLGDSIFVTDRGYWLGRYTLDGKYVGKIAENVSAITASGDGLRLLTRNLEKPWSMIAVDGSPVWTTTANGDRTPAPGTIAGGYAYMTSGIGLLSVSDAETGTLAWRYRVSPKLFVHSTPVVEDGVVYTTGLDGWVTAVVSTGK